MHAAVIAWHEAAAIEASSMTHRVLLVENDVAIAIAILDALNHSGDDSFEVEWVRRCAEGLARLDGIVAIVVDLGQPDNRGLDAFDTLFHAAPRIPILVLVDPQDENTGKLALHRGAQDYLLKSHLERDQLPKALRSMIERATHSEALFEEKERACATLNSIGDAVVSADASCQITYLNSTAEGLTGWTHNEAVGHPIEEVLHFIDAETRATAQNPITQAVLQDRAVALVPNCVLLRRDGTTVSIEDSVAPIHDRRGELTGAVMVFHDVSVARAMTLRMSHLAQHDSLTDLPNRVLLNDRLAEAIILSQRHQRKLAVLFVDLDRFKHINDSLGHATGDGLLKSVAQRLFTCVRSSDTVGRHGGDEFVVLLWDLRTSQDAVVTATKILEALREPHYINKHNLHVTGSIGIATYPEDGTDAETLMRRADLAMYNAKQAGCDGYRFFESEMNARASARQALEEDLHYAIERQELALYYQPKLNLATGAIIGAEALLRWRHPQRGLLLPGQFIPIAEDCGLIVSIGRWVLHEACRQMRAWQITGQSPLSVSINISAMELRVPEFVSNVLATLATTGLEPRCLELELTETGLMEDFRGMTEPRSFACVLKELKEIGVLLALDEFGTGFSSLSHLNRFPIDTLKIDQSFVRDLTGNGDSTGIVMGLIGMGRCLRMRVVAEGVETLEQLEILAQHGCPEGQGYYFSRPVPAEEFGRVLESDAAGTHLYDHISLEEMLLGRELVAA
jgi:diguanylate cyclase (GGDEF)-like protein/PAS domain S-box-containing protein